MAESGEVSKTKEEKGWPIKYFIIRTTARQEVNVALMLEAIAKSQGRGLYSIIVPPDIKGYVVLEAAGLHIVHQLTRDVKHVKGRAMGALTREEVERMIIVKPPIEELKPGDIVEIISGPFKGLKASVISVDLQKNEVTLNILEASYKLEATVPGDYVKIVKK